MKSFHRLLAAACCALSLPASAAEKYATSAKIDKKQASLTISSADCADNPECVAATFACVDGGFSLGVNGVETGEAGILLKDRQGAATLAVDAKPFSFNAQKLEFTEMDGAWEVELANRESPADVWKALAHAKKVTLSVGGHTLAFPGDNNLAKVAKACAK